MSSSLFSEIQKTETDASRPGCDSALTGRVVTDVLEEHSAPLLRVKKSKKFHKSNKFEYI